MKIKAVLLAAACAIGGTSVASAQSFSDIYGRTLTDDRGTVVIYGNGRITGQFGDDAFEGTWWSNDQGHFCRVGTFQGQNLPERCQTIAMGNGSITFSDVDGDRVVTYRIN